MRIGITFDLKTDEAGMKAEGGGTSIPSPVGPDPSCLPDDFQEEFDSPITIEAIAAALRDLGHEVDLLGNGRELIERLLADPPEFVFNIAEGQGIGRSREARVPALLEMLGIPYTGSDPLTLAATLDKDCAKRLVQTAGVAVPRGLVIAQEGTRDEGRGTRANNASSFLPRPSPLAPRPSSEPLAPCPSLDLPVIVKPAWEGSSKGIRGHCLVERWDDLPAVVDSLRRDHRQPVVVEEFIQGDELTVGMIGNDAPEIVGIMRVLPQQPAERFIYSLEVKRDYQRQVRYECPARLPAETLERIAESARAAYHVLGCRDVARIDFRLRDGIPYFLEVNPLPGLNPETSDLVILARLSGWSYPRLIRSILQAAMTRLSLHPVAPVCQTRRACT
jgi:D-alanine-D-alanine ligase